MKTTTKISLTLATLVLALAVATTHAQAEDTSSCQTVYGGGQICGAYTPAPTGADSNTLYTLAISLYTTGLTSFVLSTKAKSLIPQK